MKILFVCMTLLLITSCSEDDQSINHPPTIYALPVDVNDLALTHMYEDKLFREYGELLGSPEGNNKLNFHPEFYLPLGHEVTAVSVGVVAQIDELSGPEDLNLFVKPDDAPKWRIAYEHISNLTVKVGDRISIGQIVGEVSPFKQELGKIALLIIHGVESRKKGGITSYCPFMLLDESVKDEILADVILHVEKWEENNGDVFNEDEWIEIGCNREKMTETEAQNP